MEDEPTTILESLNKSDNISHFDPKDCALLVMSCDAYEDLWAPFFNLLERHWSDCPFTIYLGAEQKKWSRSNVTSLSSAAGGRNWSGRLADYLEQLCQRHVLLVLDDFFLRKTVRNEPIMTCLLFAREHSAAQVRLIPRPKPTTKIRNNYLIGENCKGSPYRLSTQAAIWDRRQLLALLRPDESIWEFEHNGNARINTQNTGFYSVWHAVLPYEGILAHHVVEKGKWLPHERWCFSRKGVGCDFSARPSLSFGRTLLYHFAQVIDWSLRPLPWKWVVVVKNTIRWAISPILRDSLRQMHGADKKML